MRNRKWAPVAIAFLCFSCNSQRFGSRALAPEGAAEVDREVKEFAAAVAHDVTQDGPAAWRRHFSDGPTFFMATEGKLQFPDSASATAGIQELTHTIKHIELKRSDVRVDPLTPELAGMAAGWHEVVELAEGKRVEQRGYFTGVVEHRNGRWQFRSAHWSVAAASGAVP